MRRSGSSCIGDGEHLVPAGDVRQLLRHVPLVGVERALGRARVLLEALLEQARDGRLRRADRAVQQDDALLGAVALRRRLEDVDQLHERDVEAVDRVAPAVLLVLEEVVADQLLLVVDVLFLAVRQDHVVDALERGARDLRVLADDLQVVLEGAVPVQLLVLAVVLQRRDLRGQVHSRSPGWGHFDHSTLIAARRIYAAEPPDEKATARRVGAA